MNKIESTSTAELEKIQRELSNPQTLQEHIILFGVTTEIENRFGKPCETNLRIDLEEKETEVDELKEKISSLNKKIGELEERLSQSANLETKTEVPA